MKSITDVIALTLILLIAMSMVGLLWLFSTGTLGFLTSSGDVSMNQTLVTISSCMKIESVSGNQVFIRNCGKGSITNDTLKVYLDDIPLNITSFFGPSGTPRTFGNTVVGGSSFSAWIGATHVVRFNLPEAGSIIKITAYVSKPYEPPPIIHAGIYDDSGGNPNNLKGTTSNTTVGTPGWYDFVFSTPLSLPAGTYHIGLSAFNNDFTWYYSAGDTNQYHYTGYWYFPNPWPVGTTQNRNMSIYATYTTYNLINEDEVGTVTLSGLWNFNPGGHTLRVSNPKVITERPVEAVLPDSNVLNLEFEEGSGNIAYDNSGYNNSCILNGDTSWSTGKYGYGLKFDGTYDDAICGNDQSIRNITDAITIEAWVNPDIKGINLKWIGKYQSWSMGLWTLAYFELVWDTNYAWTASGENIQVGNWYHVMGVYDKNFPGYVSKLYINGLENYTAPGYQNTIGGNHLINVSDNNLYLGQLGTGYAYFNGTIDNVRIYNKALTPDEVIVLKPVSYD